MLSNTQIERVKNLIKIESGIDVNQKSREREVVEMRAVHVILRDDAVDAHGLALAPCEGVGGAAWGAVGPVGGGSGHWAPPFALAMAARALVCR